MLGMWKLFSSFFSKEKGGEYFSKEVHDGGSEKKDDKIVLEGQCSASFAKE
jgi:hypothetical protein